MKAYFILGILILPLAISLFIIGIQRGNTGMIAGATMSIAGCFGLLGMTLGYEIRSQEVGK